MKLLWNILWAPVLILAYVIVPIVWAISEGLFGAFRGVWGKPKPSDTHGDADFATDKELERAGNLSPGGFMLGVTSKTKRRVYSHDERSVLMFAGPGQGKSQSIIAGLMAISAKQVLPTLLIGDAAGEIYQATAAHFKRLGYDIGVIDLSDPDRGMKYDILTELNPNEVQFERCLEDMAMLLVPEEPNARQPHFVRYSRRVMIALIRLNMMYESNNKTLPEIINEYMDETKREAVIRRIDLIDDNKVTGPIRRLQKMENTPEYNSMFTTLERIMAPWRDDVVQKISEYGPDMYGRKQRGWGFKRVFENPKPVVIFVRQGLLGDPGAIARAIYGNAINAVKKEWDATGKPLARPLRVIIDEPAKTGNCKAVVEAHNELRKAGVTVLMPFLSYHALKQTYHEDAKTLLNGCDLVVFGGSKEMDFLQDISRMVGDYTIESKGASESDHGESRSKNEQARARIKPDEIRRQGSDKVLVVIDGLTAMLRKGYEKTKNGPRYL